MNAEMGMGGMAASVEAKGQTTEVYYSNACTLKYVEMSEDR